MIKDEVQRRATRRLRERRIALGLTQEEAASLVTRAGFPCTRGDLAAWELGRTTPGLLQLVLIDAALNQGKPMGLQGLMGEEPLAGGPEGYLSPEELISLLNGRLVPRVAAALWAASSDGNRASTDDLVRRVAARLEYDPAEVDQAAQELWNRGLSEERDRRLSEAPPERRGKGAKGRVTRRLIEEIADLVQTGRALQSVD